MSWDSETWDAFCGLIDEAWPGTFDDQAANSWRVLLDGTDPADAVAAMRRLLLRGQRFRPSVSELLGELRADPSKPTFEEAFALIFGPRGVLAARPTANGPVTFASEADRAARQNQAALDRANEMHPLVAAFVARQGVGRLRELQVEDPDYGELRRKELRDAWDRHLEATDGRDVAALAVGDRSELGMRRFDPLAALGLERPAEIEAAS